LQKLHWLIAGLYMVFIKKKNGLWTKKSYQSVKDLIVHTHRELIVTFSCLLEVSEHKMMMMMMMKVVPICQPLNLLDISSKVSSATCARAIADTHYFMPDSKFSQQ